MITLLPAILAFAFSFSRAVAAIDETWKFFKLNKTTEGSVILLFGTPDVVKIQLSYENLKKAKESTGTAWIPAYVLHYNRLRGDLNILKGPLGEAAATEVQIEDGKVVAVDWNYEVKYKAAAETLWKSDKSFTTKLGRAITIGSKRLTDGNVLFVTCTTGGNGSCDGLVQVTLGPDPDKK